MANTTTLRRRISSVRNTRQITKAMELVSASKMRRAQERAKLSRAYQEMAYSILARLSSLSEVSIQPLFTKRQVTKRLYVVVTSDNGLAGAYNYNVLKKLTESMGADRRNSIKNEIIVIGKKGAQFVSRLDQVNLLAVYPAFGDQPTTQDIQPILNTILEYYRDQKIDQANLIYTLFKSNFVQQVESLDLLPAKLSQDVEPADYKYDFSNFEPSVEVVVDNVAARLIETQIWQALLESLASEHSMRMIAMKNATDNANDLIDDLTLEFNTARQASITQQLAEISGGVEALKD
jgi:F-type H+-transporting ATPase subunit gamma